ncbi:LPS export ABC transporter permease LptF [Magnetococcales bacterium HHB-1]
MHRISRYLFSECTWTVLITLTVMTFIALLPQALQLVDLWVNKGVSAQILAELTALVIPKFIVRSIPMALLLGILLALGRMSQDSEMVILKASGISLLQIARPIAFLILLSTLLSLWLNWVWVPQTRHMFSKMRTALISSVPFSIQPQTFTRAIHGITIYVNEQDQNGRTFHGLFVHDHRNPERPVTLTAKSGYLQNSNESTILFLTNGSRHHKTPNSGYRQLNFSSYNLDLGVSLGLKFSQKKDKLEEMTLEELLIFIQNATRQNKREATMELHRRLAVPIASLILGMLAIPLGIQSHRSGRGYGFVVAIILLILHFLLLTLGESMAEKQFFDPLVGFWLPNLLMAILTIYVYYLTQRERPFKAALWLAQMISVFPQRFLLRGGARPPQGV